jgi:hypothetical protein
MSLDSRVQFISESPESHSSERLQSFIQQELCKPNKIWVHEVLSSRRECESVKLRTEDFVLLPDVNSGKRQTLCTAAFEIKPLQGLPRWAGGRNIQQKPPVLEHCPAAVKKVEQFRPKQFSWLAIISDPSIRTIRDLRGCHVPMLESLYDQCVAVIRDEFGLVKQDIIAFANYPPSVYRLHFHFCAPFFSSGAFDAFRMHSLDTIINNLKICPDYYRLSTMYVPVYTGSDLYRVWSNHEGDSDEAEF